MYLVFCHPVNLCPCQQKCTRAIHLCHFTGYFFGGSTNRLHIAQFTIFLYCPYQSFPALFHYGKEFFFRQQSFVDAVCQSIDKETGTTGFRRRIRMRVQHTGSPKAVRLLQGGYTSSQFHKQVLIKSSVFIFRRKFTKNFDQSTQYPSVSSPPKHLLTIGLFLSKVTMVSIKQTGILIIKELISLFILLIHKTEKFLITGNVIQTGINRRSHK